MKDEELTKQMPIGGDVPTLLQQQNYCTVRTVAMGNVPATLYKIYHTLSLIVFKFPKRVLEFFTEEYLFLLFCNNRVLLQCKSMYI